MWRDLWTSSPKKTDRLSEQKATTGVQRAEKLPNECICDIIACWRTKIFAGQRFFGSGARSSFTTGARGKVRGHSLCFQSFIFSWNGVLCGQVGTSRCHIWAKTVPSLPVDESVRTADGSFGTGSAIAVTEPRGTVCQVAWHNCWL